MIHRMMPETYKHKSNSIDVFVRFACDNLCYKRLYGIDDNPIADTVRHFSSNDNKKQVKLIDHNGFDYTFPSVRLIDPPDGYEHSIGELAFLFKSIEKNYLVHANSIQVCFGSVVAQQSNKSLVVKCTREDNKLDFMHNTYTIADVSNGIIKERLTVGDKCVVILARESKDIVTPLCLVAAIVKPMFAHLWNEDKVRLAALKSAPTFWHRIQNTCEKRFRFKNGLICHENLSELIPNRVPLPERIFSGHRNGFVIDYATVLRNKQRSYREMPWHGIDKSKIVQFRRAYGNNNFTVTCYNKKKTLVNIPRSIRIKTNNEYFFIKNAPYCNQTKIFTVEMAHLCCANVMASSTTRTQCYGHRGYMFTAQCDQHPGNWGSNIFLPTITSQMPIQVGDRVLLMLHKSGTQFCFMAIIGAFITEPMTMLWTLGQFGLTHNHGNWAEWETINKNVPSRRITPPQMDCTKDLMSTLCQK